jgi:hypothetical protein
MQNNEKNRKKLKKIEKKRIHEFIKCGKNN